MGFKTILVPIEQHDLVNPTLQTALNVAGDMKYRLDNGACRNGEGA
jgi:hypothetical protein